MNAGRVVAARGWSRLTRETPTDLELQASALRRGRVHGAMTLETWRRDVVGLSLAEAARRAGISQAHASAIEQRPDRASLGAVRAYVAALGGRLAVSLERGGGGVEMAR